MSQAQLGLICLSLVVASIVGAMLSAFLLRSAFTVAEGPIAARDDAALATEIRRLATVVDKLDARLGSLPSLALESLPPTSRAPVGTGESSLSAVELEGLVEALRQLGARLERMPTPSGVISTPPASTHAEELFPANVDPQSRGLEIEKDHILWTIQDLLLAYGRPDSAQPIESGYLVYYTGAIQGQSVWFRLIDGLVLDADYVQR